jgi:hypothetical protein
MSRTEYAANAVYDCSSGAYVRSNGSTSPRHGWRKYLLHDDFYDQNGTANQPEIENSAAGMLAHTLDESTLLAGIVMGKAVLRRLFHSNWIFLVVGFIGLAFATPDRVGGPPLAVRTGGWTTDFGACWQTARPGSVAIWAISAGANALVRLAPDHGPPSPVGRKLLRGCRRKASRRRIVVSSSQENSQIAKPFPYY